MIVPPATVARGIRAASRLSPALGGALALRAFFAVGPRTPVREDEAPTDLAATRSQMTVRGRAVTVYEWGSGRRTVLLLHGWQGRAAQFAPLVRELAAEGCHVVAFDAPAHGRSAGRDADIRDWVAVAAAVERRHGPVVALVGHSLGGLAALTAARADVSTRRVAVIASAGRPDAFLDRFSEELGLRPAVRAQLRARFLARLGEDEDSARLRYDAVAHPLPRSVELLVVHDREDRRMPDADALKLHAAHQDRSRMLRTTGCGHTRILASDALLDAVTDFVVNGHADGPADREGERESERPRALAGPF